MPPETRINVNVDTKGNSLRSRMAGRIHAIDARAMEMIIGSDSYVPPQRAEVQASTQPAQQQRIAVIPIMGVIEPRASMWTRLFGGAACDLIGQQLAQAVADPNVSSIVLLIDSPGGYLQGTPELSTKIYNARSEKPIIAIADGLACSGGYWLGTSASEFYVTPSGEVGSVGVYALHADWSKFNEAFGIKYTYISAGKFKTEGNPDEPLSEETLQFFQQGINEGYDMFLAAVRRNRKDAKVKSTSKTYGDGRVFNAAPALELGLVDGIQTFDQVIERLSKKNSSQRRQRVSSLSVDVYG